ncbi:MAG: FtsX-like permease family protein, partial [Chitinispirillaceae bacterium]|nr:FtsX-like permease family protein [Chitinispirillaceae bacterium]
MPFYLSIAFKNIFRDLRRSMTLGVNYFFIALLLLLVFSLTRGVRSNITDNVLTSTAGHITISGEYVVKGRTFQGIRNYQQVAGIIRKQFPDARVYTRYSVSSAVYNNGVSKRLSFTGIDTDSDQGLRNQITIADGSWDAFADQPNAVIMPQSVAAYFGLKRDDEVLISTRSRFGAFNTGTIQLRGLSKTGNYFLRDLVISHFGFLRSLDLADSVTASRMFLFFDKPESANEKRTALLAALKAAGFVADKPASSTDAINAVAAASPRYKPLADSVNQIRLTLATAQEVTGLVSQVTNAVNGIGLFVAAIMLFIISISIFINMRMTINERMQEIGTLRAIGAEQKDVVQLFLAENVFLCLLFVIGGLAAALALIGLAGAAVTLPPDGALGLFL